MIQRLCRVDTQTRVILRCFYNDLNGQPIDVLLAPEPWAQEGAHYDNAKAAWEAAQAAELARVESIKTDTRLQQLYTRLKTSSAQDIVDFVANQLPSADAATRQMFVRILLLLADKL